MKEVVSLVKLRKIFSLAAVLVLLTGIIIISNVAAATYPYQDPALPIETRLDDLLARMTLNEKAGQMIQAERGSATAADVKTYFLGSILSGGGSVPSPNTPTGWCNMINSYQTSAMGTRLQIPMIYGADAVHGHNNVSGATIFPHNIGMGAANDADLTQREGVVVANEVRATGVHWTFAPCITVPQNEKWGRTYEGYSEDTTLVGNMGVAFVKGAQGVNFPGDLTGNEKCVVCIKHYIGDGATDGGVNAGNATMTDAVMRAKYLPPYTAGVNAGARTVMISYNQINGLQCHANGHITTDILKGELGFNGLVVSDWNGIDNNDPTYRTAVKIAVNAGIDMIMVPTNWKTCLNDIINLVNTGEVTQARIDDAARRILRVKMQLGLFEKPYPDTTLMSNFGSAAHRDIAREAVRKSLVLLKNDTGILPLAKSGKKIFVAGKCADNIGYQCGGWTITWQGGSGAITTGTSILQGIRNVASGDTITYNATGSGASGNDVAIVVIGETPYAEGSGDNQTLALDSTDTTCLTNVKNSGVPMVVVLISGRPLIVQSYLGDWKAFVAAWLPGTEGQGVAQVLFGDYNFSGKLPHTWPQTVSQIPISSGDGKTPLFALGAGLTYSGSATPTPSGPTPTPGPTATPTPTPTPANKVLPGKIEAENYNAMSGVQTETTSDTGGGLNVGWIELNDWMDYNVNVQTAGAYRIDYRVASPNATGKVDFRVNSTTLATTTIPNTGGWQAWTTVSANVTLSAGAQTIRLFASGGGWNINWFQGTSGGAATATPTPTRPPGTATPTPTSPPATATPTPTPGGNLALNKTATASSTENSSYPASYAVDGSTSTRWSSAFSDPQWLKVDLGSSRSISRVILKWEAAYGKSYQVQTSTDNTNWTTVWSTTTGAGGNVTATFTAISARYVRMYGTVRGTAYGYSLWEFEVYQ
jgi:beta-glucosidase